MASLTKLVAPIKGQSVDDESVPDVRPIGVGEVLFRAIHRSLATAFKEPSAARLWPQQVAVGVEGGIRKLVRGLHLATEANPDWVVVKTAPTVKSRGPQSLIG